MLISLQDMTSYITLQNCLFLSQELLYFKVNIVPWFELKLKLL